MDTTKVLVMNDVTWEGMRNDLIRQASMVRDPMDSLGRFKGIDIEIDNRLPNGYVEAYERWMLDKIKKMEDGL